MAPHYCGCRSFSTWWAIMGQHKDFKEIQDLDSLSIIEQQILLVARHGC